MSDAPASELFEITCGCGRAYEGARTEIDQVLECNHCGRRLFVLPRSPYPDLTPVAETDEPDLPRHRKSRRKRKPDDAADPGPADTKETGPAEVVASPESEPESLTLRRRPRLVTPLRLIIVAMLGLLAATVYWQYQRSVRNRAEREFREHSDKGYAALKDTNFVEAYREFRLAVAALDRLPRDDAKARHVRQMARESTAASDLISKTMPEILTEAERLLENEPVDWRRKLNRYYGGHWVVLDTFVRTHKDANGDESLVFDYPLIVGRRVVRFQGRPAVFAGMKAAASPARAILAFEIEEIDVSADSRNWIVHIDPESAFLWCDYANFRAIGFTVAAETDEDVEGEVDTRRELRAILAAQSRTMGVTR
ncbi:MAG: hypothetical protein ACE5KM_15365 [Planctomycetaceae bacterium]